MKTPMFATAVLCAATLGLSNVALAAPSASPTPSASPSAVQYTPYDGLLLGTKIVGSKVLDPQKQDIGTIDDLVVNPDTGRVRFAVLGVDGVSEKVVVPWGAIALEKNKPGEAPTYLVNAKKDKLEKAPKFNADKLSELYAQSTAQPIFDYYEIVYFDDVVPAGKTNGAKATPSPTPKKD
jgi:hypothetical protein